MAEGVKVAAWRGGELSVFTYGEAGREAVLALPLSRLVARMVRVEKEADAVQAAGEVLSALNPFPDDPLAIAVETVSEDEHGRIVAAAALPESAAEDVAEAMDAQKLSVFKVDILEFGQIRKLFSERDFSDGRRRVVKFANADGISLMVMDGDMPVALRSVADEADVPLQTQLSLLEAEDFGGAKELAETVEVELSLEDASAGVAERAAEPETLNALPESWGGVLAETRFKSKLVRRLAVAGGVWLLIMGVLFGVPVVYGYMTDYQKDLSKQHQRQFLEVKAMKEKVNLVRKYSDHNRSSLEIMKAISDRLPGGVTVTSWTFKRDEGVNLAGEADAASEVYKFKDDMTAMKFGESEDAAPVFQVVNLNGPTAAKNKQRFSLELLFEVEEGE